VTRVVVALDSLKGSIGAAEASAAVAAGWQRARPGDEVLLRPMADGGEGTLDAFAAAVSGAQRVPVTVRGPHGRPVAADWLLLPDGTGVVELAATSGIELLGGQLRPWDADTFGFGQAIAGALDHGVERLVLGIGSSASTDGGAGVLTALGARVLDAAGELVVPGVRGLETAASVDLSQLRDLPPGGVVVLSDVTNPLCGPRGAAAVFGPQKGLDALGVAAADAALARFAALVAGALTGVEGPGAERAGAASARAAAAAVGADAERAGSRRVRRLQLDTDRRAGQQRAHSAGADPATPGAGAAGGTGFALLAWGGELRPGAAEVATLIGLDAAIAGADLVVTGEGSYDGQSAAGKAPAHVAALAATAGVSVALIAGRVTADADTSAFAASLALAELAGSAEASLAAPARWLRVAGAELAARAG